MPKVSNTRVVAIGDEWINPGDPRWKKPRVFKGTEGLAKGLWKWHCGNHPERKAGRIRGGSTSNWWYTNKWDIVFGALLKHMDKYHNYDRS